MSSRDEKTPPPSPDRLEDLDRRLRERQNARRARENRGRRVETAGLGVAMRLSVELVVALGVGAALGYGIDRLAGTKPWIMLVGIGFGFAAGVRNAVRAAQDMQAIAAEGDAESDEEAADDGR